MKLLANYFNTTDPVLEVERLMRSIAKELTLSNKSVDNCATIT